jgi:Tol biopolymer transport system component/DNA-binding winged helix-turn-helix (wHTH) protein
MPGQARPQVHSNRSSDDHIVRFDRYEADVRSGELRKEGRKVRLQAQPFQLLVLLLKNAGRVVSREDVRRELWPGDTFVDFDHGLAAAVNKIRDALCDSADKPRFIETLPRRGYRFIGQIEPDPPMEIRPRLEEAAFASKLSDSATEANIRIQRLNRTRAWAVGAALVLLGASIAAAIVLLLGQKPPEPPPQEWNVTQFTSYPGATSAPAFSPDGSRIAFGWDPKSATDYNLYVKALGGEALLQLTHHPSTWISAAWSPDGTQIAFMRLAGADTGLYVIPALGGPEQKLLATTTPYELAAPISWSPDGKWIAYDNQIDAKTGDRMFLFSVETSESHIFYHDPACMHEANLTFSNDGKQVAWFCVKHLDAFDVMVGDSAGHSRRAIRTVNLFPVGLGWSPDDKKLVIPQQGEDESHLFELNLHDGSMKPSAAGANELHAIWPTVSAKTGATAWNAYRYHNDLIRKDLNNPTKTPEPFLESSKDENQASYSPDGKYIAFDSDRSGVWNVWIGDADGTNLTQVSRGIAGYPRWSPDSRQIAYQQLDGDGKSVYVANVDQRVGHKLITAATDAGAPFWSADGKSVYFEDYGSFRRKYYRCSLDCDKNETLVRDGPKAINMQVSADDKAWYWINPDGPYHLFHAAMRDGQVEGGEELVDIPHLHDEYSFFVAKNGVYFVPSDKPNTLKFFDFATRKTKELFIAKKAIGTGFWISSDGRTALLGQSSDNHQDIMLAEPKR